MPYLYMYMGIGTDVLVALGRVRDREYVVCHEPFLVPPTYNFPRLRMPYLYMYMGIGTDVNVFHLSCCMASHMSQASYASCRSLSAKEPLIIGLFCGKWPMNIRHLMHLRYPFLASHMSALYEKASNESCHKDESRHARMSHVTQERVTSCIWLSHVPRMACTERLPMEFRTTICWWH